MAANRIMRSGAVRRALPALLASAVLALLLASCGGEGSGRTTASVSDNDGDAAILNEILSRQTAAVAAYGAALPGLKDPALELARLFRAQEQEHVDGVLKALRGLGERAEPEPEAIEADGLKSTQDFLRFFYEIESATIEAEMSAIANLTAPGARGLLAATAANQAQHLVLLRRALGVEPLATVPTPFENGATPAP
ncbi:MAG: ferritin-like domain-containing protein [Solirubrobacterales bacterium]